MTPIAKDEATAYRERWPSWVHEAFAVEPMATNSHHFVKIVCTLDGGCKVLVEALAIDLRHDPPPSLLREMRVHIKGHGYVPTTERAR